MKIVFNSIYTYEKSIYFSKNLALTSSKPGIPFNIRLQPTQSHKSKQGGHYMKYLRYPVYIFLILSILGSSKCGIYSQKAADIFANGKWPAILEELANPPLPHDLEQQILNRPNSPHLRVAVIDDGLDYLHPGLINNINFKVDQNQVTGAGFDILGADSWAHPNLIDASLFAFGAEDLDQNHKIINPPEDPLALYDQMNTRFMGYLLESIKNQPELRESLFNRMTKDSMSLAGYIEYLYGKSKFSLTDYNKAKNEKRLYSWDSRENKKFKANDEFSLHQEKTFRYLLDWPWIVGSDSGWPKMSEFSSLSLFTLMKVEHADLFFEALEGAYGTLVHEMNLDLAFNTYTEFRISRLPSQSKSLEGYKEQFAQDLHKAWYKAKYKYKDSDPIVNLIFSIRENLPSETLNALYYDNLSIEEKELLIYDTLDQWSERLKAAYTYQIEHPSLTTASERAAIQKNLDGLDHIIQQLKNYIYRRGSHQLFLDFPSSDSTDDKGYQNYGHKVHHPYLAGDANQNASHGTHVSGIVIAQDQRLLIEPVRVLTGSKAHSKVIDEQLKNSYLKGLEAWLNQPLVIHSAYQLMQKIIDPEKELNPKTSGNEIIQKIIELAKAHAELHIDNNRLEYEFFEEVIGGIKYVGQQQIKVANISLGTTFSSVPARINPNDTEQLTTDILKFLKYEYFKYSVAEAAQTHAPHTLFLIASGNQGNWVDGKSRSALPVDLSSPFLHAMEESLGLEAPNNKIDNILAVGSIGPNHDISSFSNLPITNVPFIFAQGESILSAIKETDFSGAIHEYTALHGSEPISQLFSPADRRMIQMTIDLGWVQGNNPNDRQTEIAARNALESINFLAQTLVPESYKAFRLEHCLDSLVCEAKLSGTSMATPVVSGKISSYILDKMLSLGLSEADIYSHSEFTPKKIIEEFITQHTEPYGGRSPILANVPTLRAYEPYQVVPRRQSLKATCANILSFD